MKRLLQTIATLLLLAPTVFAGARLDFERNVPQPGTTSPIVNERALVIKLADGGESCSLFDGDGNLVYGEGGIKVITFSANGNMMVRCQARDLANGTGSAVTFTADDNPIGPGTKCGILAPDGLCLTDSWINVVSASGRGHIVCHFRNASCE